MNSAVGFDIHAIIAESQHDDSQLDRFYKICMFPKPQNGPRHGRQYQHINSNPVDIGQEFFDGLLIYHNLDQIIPLFIRLYHRLPEYLKNHEAMHNSRSIVKCGLNFFQFFFQCFLLYLKTLKEREKQRLRAARVTAVAAIKQELEESSVLKSASSAEMIEEFQISEEQRCHIFYLIVRLDFPSRVKVWTLLATAGISVLAPNSHFPEIVKEAADGGVVAFWALRYTICKFPLTFEDVSILQQLLMLGRVSAHLIEEFLAERSEVDRDKARQLLLQAEYWGTSPQLYHNAIVYAGRYQQGVLSFNEFSNNMVDLMIELRREMPRSNLISLPWAYRAIKDYFEKVYVKNEWTTEQLYDLIFTILRQRPTLRSNVISEFRKYKDALSAEYWRKFVIDIRFPHFQSSILNNKLNIPPQCVYKLSTEEFDMHEERPNHLSIPYGVDVYVVDNSAKLKIIEFEIDKCVKSDYAVLGLDAEWSPFVGASFAQILQIAFRNVIFIVDLDAIKDVDFCLTQFMDKLFQNEKVIKIGFHFAEDLNQLRKKTPNCLGLYVPHNLICISKLVAHLYAVSKEKDDFDIHEFIVMHKLTPPKQATEGGEEMSLNSTQDSIMSEEVNTTTESVNTSVDSINTTTESMKTEATNDSIASSADVIAGEDEQKPEQSKVEKTEEKHEAKAKQKMKNFSLSALCDAILGKPLDKTEQCSDWARRPLRMSQIKYSALDAYCQLMIYDRCAAWATKLGLDIVEITDAQERISTPLPLFFDFSKMLSSSPKDNQ
ncbi:hypothetical protein M3Y98_00343600 [Aphelenchoides besseyi]|nr:hypothetical protein M3Y98_00343600 [Aphelenchoides besseyi]KAI6194385.1 hypothetical protein M3Y96_01119100 [Aphelenchoides besseyi]